MKTGPDKIKKHIEMGNRFRLIRGHLSQKEFAKKIKVPFRTYQRYESGKNIPKAIVLFKISAIYQMPIEWFYTGKSIKWPYVEDPAALKELMKLDRKKKKTNEDIEKTHAILDIAWKEKITRGLSIEGATTSQIEDFIKSLPKPLHRYLEESSPLLRMIKQLERIYNEGDKNKIEAIRAQLNVLDPEAKVNVPSIKKTSN